MKGLVSSGAYASISTLSLRVVYLAVGCYAAELEGYRFPTAVAVFRADAENESAPV